MLPVGIGPDVPNTAIVSAFHRSGTFLPLDHFTNMKTGRTRSRTRTRGLSIPQLINRSSSSTGLWAFRTSSPEALPVRRARCSSTANQSRPSCVGSGLFSGGAADSRVIATRTAATSSSCWSKRLPDFQEQRLNQIIRATMHLRKAQWTELRSDH